jgi:hypothetical protein
LIDRHLTKLAAIEAYAVKHGDIDRYERVVRADSIITGTDVGSAVKRNCDRARLKSARPTSATGRRGRWRMKSGGTGINNGRLGVRKRGTR